MSRRITTLNQAIELALRTKDTGEIDANLKIDVDGEVWTAYTASITHRDILFYCNKGTATFLVDSYGDRHVAELFNWEKETSNE